MDYKGLCRVILIGGILSIALLTWGCTYSIGFYINNLSDREVIVSYSLRNLQYALEPELISKGDSNDFDYLKVPAERLKVDLEKRVVEFNLLPGERVRIIRMYDRGSLSDYEDAFNLTRLGLTSSNGQQQFGGHQVFAQFKPVEKGSFEFGPKFNRFELEYR